jgi:hypothetical protein
MPVKWKLALETRKTLLFLSLILEELDVVSGKVRQDLGVLVTEKAN